MGTGNGTHDQVRVGLALSGGGARGLGQLGVLKVLEREGIPVHLVAGTSIGSVMGGLYACSGSAAETEERALAALEGDHMRGLDLERILKLSGMSRVKEEREEGAPHEAGWLGRTQKLMRRVYASHAALTRPAVIEGEVVLDMFEALFDGRSFESTKIPFAAVAVDIQEGRPVIIASGSIALGVAASSAIAGIFPPVRIGGRELIDGGYTSPIPIDAVQTLGANVVIAVDISLRGVDRGRLGNAVEVAMRSSEISLLALEREQLRRADVVIPARGKPRHWSDYSDPQEAIGAGEAAAERMLDSITTVIEERSRLFI